MKKVLLNKYVSLFFIVFGLIFSAINTLSLLEGYLAIKNEPPPPKLSLNKQWNQSGLEKLHQMYQKKPMPGEKIGELYIPRLEETYPIYEGTTSKVLKKGVGHYSRSFLPGEPNNTVLSGHRDTFFRGLEKLKKKDRLIVTTNKESYLYKIKKIRIVDAKDKTVISPKPKAILTLTTCYPFYFIGNAPKRYIIIAEMIS